MIQVLARNSTNARETLMKIARVQLLLLIPNARAIGAVETKTSTESVSETVIESTDHLTNTARATVLTGTIDREAEIVIEIVNTAIVTAAANPKTFKRRKRERERKSTAQYLLLPLKQKRRPADHHLYLMVRMASKSKAPVSAARIRSKKLSSPLAPAPPATGKTKKRNRRTGTAKMSVLSATKNQIKTKNASG
jgi:hypothetical protein